MHLNHYRFRSVWTLELPPAAVFKALASAEDYPHWWPQVREVTRSGEHTAVARFRSLLPYELVVAARELRQDPEAGVLEAALSGDLEGWARWTVTPHDQHTSVVYEQQVEVRKPLMRRLALPGRPLFLVNHALMMRAGRRGLRTWLRQGI